MKYMQLKNS